MKLPLEVLGQRLNDADEQVPIDSFWLHAKSNRVFVVCGLTIDEETQEVRVSYHEFMADQHVPFSRKLSSFTEPGRFVPLPDYGSLRVKL